MAHFAPILQVAEKDMDLDPNAEDPAPLLTETMTDDRGWRTTSRTKFLERAKTAEVKASLRNKVRFLSSCLAANLPAKGAVPLTATAACSRRQEQMFAQQCLQNVAWARARASRVASALQILTDETQCPSMHMQ